MFIQDCGTYNHQNAHFVSLHINLFSKNNIKHNDLSTLSFVICRLPVMWFTRNVDEMWMTLTQILFYGVEFSNGNAFHNKIH